MKCKHNYIKAKRDIKKENNLKGTNWYQCDKCKEIFEIKGIYEPLNFKIRKGGEWFSTFSKDKGDFIIPNRLIVFMVRNEYVCLGEHPYHPDHYIYVNNDKSIIVWIEDKVSFDNLYNEFVEMLKDAINEKN